MKFELVFDAELRRLKNKLLKKLIPESSIDANWITFVALLSGLVSMWFLFQNNLVLAAILFILNRSLDIFDGYFAQSKEDNSMGAFLDIFSDYLVYLGILLVLGLTRPELLFELLLLVSLYTLNLLLWTFPQLLQELDVQDGQKYPRSVIEGVETTILYVMMFFWSSEVIDLFIVLMVLTVIHRSYQAFHHLQAS